jgi:hypothetical protein
MAKRFTDTNKYKKPFIRGLQGAYKLLWDFLYHDCDHAGIWIVDFEIAQSYIGKDMPVNAKHALTYFNDGEVRIVEIEGGKKWFIPSFIEFQYGQLTEKNRAHASVITILLKHQLIDTSLKIKTNKPHTSPLQGGKDMDKDKELDTDKEKEKDKDKEPEIFDFSKPDINGDEIIFPIDTLAFRILWANWKKYRWLQFEHRYGMMGEQADLKRLEKMDFNQAEKTILDAISNKWKNLYPEKNGTRTNNNGKGTSAKTDQSRATSDYLAEHYSAKAKQ